VINTAILNNCQWTKSRMSHFWNFDGAPLRSSLGSTPQYFHTFSGQNWSYQYWFHSLPYKLKPWVSIFFKYLLWKCDHHSHNYLLKHCQKTSSENKWHIFCFFGELSWSHPSIFVFTISGQKPSRTILSSLASKSIHTVGGLSLK